MEIPDYKMLDKLANLARELEQIERGAGKIDDAAGLIAARESVLSALYGVFQSDYDFAAAVCRYRPYFKQEHTWTAAIGKIAAARDCSSRTLYRLLRNYDAAQQLPLPFVEAMLAEGIDPVQDKHRELVKSLATAAKPVSTADAKAAVKVTRSSIAAMKAPAPSPLNEFEVFATRVVRMFVLHYRSYRGEGRDDEIRYILERIVNVLRADVRELHTYDRPDRVRKPGKGAR